MQSYKKQNKDDNYVSTKTSEKKKKDRNKGNRVQDENNTIGESPKVGIFNYYSCLQLNRSSHFIFQLISGKHREKENQIH